MQLIVASPKNWHLGQHESQMCSGTNLFLRQQLLQKYTSILFSNLLRVAEGQARCSFSTR